MPPPLGLKRPFAIVKIGFNIPSDTVSEFAEIIKQTGVLRVNIL